MATIYYHGNQPYWLISAIATWRLCWTDHNMQCAADRTYWFFLCSSTTFSLNSADWEESKGSKVTHNHPPPSSLTDNHPSISPPTHLVFQIWKVLQIARLVIRRIKVSKLAYTDTHTPNSHLHVSLFTLPWTRVSTYPARRSYSRGHGFLQSNITWYKECKQREK